jgi:MFS superfamily sulfate permease-like transporter
MTHSTTTPVPAIVCGLFCGVLFFSSAPLIDYLPRFMLSGLLLFSAVGFLVENLWDTRRRFNRLNYSAIWAVFVINVLGGEYLSQFGLLIAIGTGACDHRPLHRPLHRPKHRPLGGPI